jgi:polyisoprenoid-binding protein YceI
MDTGDPRRDRGTFAKDPFDIDHHPVMTYRSTAVTSDDAAWRLDGELTVRGVTRAVALQVQPPRFFRDESGQHRVQRPQYCSTVRSIRFGRMSEH